jgi:hypothetical protein
MKTLSKGRKTNGRANGNASLSKRLLDDIGRCLSPAVARRIIEIRADAATEVRVAELAEKCNEGLLTDAERAEYESFISTSNFIAILQAKARALLAQHGKP